MNKTIFEISNYRTKTLRSIRKNARCTVWRSEKTNTLVQDLMVRDGLVYSKRGKFYLTDNGKTYLQQVKMQRKELLPMPTTEYEVTQADWEDSRSMRLEVAKSLNYSQAAKDEDECINHFFLAHPNAVLLVSENGK